MRAFSLLLAVLVVSTSLSLVSAQSFYCSAYTSCGSCASAYAAYGCGWCESSNKCIFYTSPCSGYFDTSSSECYWDYSTSVTHTATIVGAVVGSIGGLFVLACIIACWRRRYYRPAVVVMQTQMPSTIVQQPVIIAAQPQPQQYAAFAQPAQPMYAQPPPPAYSPQYAQPPYGQPQYAQPAQPQFAQPVQYGQPVYR